MLPDQPSDFGIVVPVGPGQRKWLLQTLRSLDAQTVHVSVAICAVEDSKELRDTLESFSHLVSYMRCSPDAGQSAAINEGWAALNAHYYGWLNDDDMLHPDALSKVLKAFQTTHADVVYGRTDIIQDSVLRIGYGDVPLGDSLRRENRIAQPSTFVKQSALAKLSGDNGQPPLDPDKHYAMDWDLWQKLYLSKAKFHRISTSLSITRWYAGTKTAQLNWPKFKEYRQIMKTGKAGPKGSWALFNIVVHQFATYGPMSALFGVMQRILQKRPRSQSTPTSDQKNHELDVFHYQNHPLKVVSKQSSKIIATALEAGYVLKTEETCVMLQPSFRD